MSKPSKRDWDLAFCLYSAGYTSEQIVSEPEFRGLTAAAVRMQAFNNGWAERRERLARLPMGNAVDNAAKSLQDKLTQQGISHQEFMLSELDRERNQFRNRTKQQDQQLERLQILEKIDNLARKVSRLDDQAPSNPITQGFAVLVHLQQSKGNGMVVIDNSKPTPSAIDFEPKRTPSAILPLPDDSEAPTGILRSNNAHPEGVESEEITIEPKEMPEPGTLFNIKPIKPK